MECELGMSHSWYFDGHPVTHRVYLPTFGAETIHIPCVNPRVMLCHYVIISCWRLK